MSRPKRPLLSITMIGVVLMTAMAAWPNESDWREQDNAYDLARQAVSRGEALPLHEIRRHLRQVAPGKIVDLQGQLRKVHIDARSGALVRVSDY
jgi:uncharacterized membrane protein YkoI